MPREGNIEAYYDVNQFLNVQDIYNTCEGTIAMLDLARMIQEGGNYYWKGYSFPEGAAQTIPAQATVSGSIQLPKGTYITAVNCYYDPNTNPEGIKLKLFDKGSKASIFYGDWALDRLVLSNMQIQYGVGASNPPSDAGMNADNPFGPAYLMNPFIVTDPGIIGWEIVNQSMANMLCQILLCCAIPVNADTIGTRIVRRT